MTITTPRPKVLSWGSNVEDKTLDDAAIAASLACVPSHVALMPDAHSGFGPPIGTVIPTLGAIIPYAIGVDIGCGMIATETDLTASDLPDSLHSLMPLIEQRIPAGVGKQFAGPSQPDEYTAFEQVGMPATELTAKQEATTTAQFGTQLAQRAVTEAKGLMRRWFIDLPDPNLAYLAQGTPEFEHYIADMLWAQRYAFGSRQAMMNAAERSLFEVAGRGVVKRTINCHHNFAQMEHHHNRDMWITRKGAIKASVGDLGVIPGSMGTCSYIVEGLGNPASYNSCSHGAGRRMSRKRARQELTVESFREAMGDREWLSGKAEQLLDEHPSSYKDIQQVMADQVDLVRPLHTLRQVFNYKGI